MVFTRSFLMTMQVSSVTNAVLTQYRYATGWATYIVYVYCGTQRIDCNFL